MDKGQQELMFKFNMFEQQIRQLQEQMQAVEQVCIELQSLSFSLDDIKGSEGKEIVAHIGRGIHARAKLLSEDLLVDIGGGNIVKKDVDGAKELIKGQVKKLEDIKLDLDKAMQSINEELTKIFLEAQRSKKKEDN
jgi:prefoldin alpha subunit